MDRLLSIVKDSKSFLDIGANVGSFSRFMRDWFSEMDILMIEANPFCDHPLKQSGIPYEIVCLSDTEKEVKFYFQDQDMQGTGASYYIEKTEHYSLKKHAVMQTKLLDDVIRSRYGEDKTFDFIKLDTQGSELDILRGGKKVASGAKNILIETSLVEYNENAPLKAEVMEYMESIGFKPLELIETHYSGGFLVQEDWMFTR